MNYSSEVAGLSPSIDKLRPWRYPVLLRMGSLAELAGTLYSTHTPYSTQGAGESNGGRARQFPHRLSTVCFGVTSALAIQLPDVHISTDCLSRPSVRSFRPPPRAHTEPSVPIWHAATSATRRERRILRTQPTRFLPLPPLPTCLY